MLVYTSNNWLSLTKLWLETEFSFDSFELIKAPVKSVYYSVKSRQYITLVIIGLFWLRALLLNVIFQVNDEHDIGGVWDLFNSATLYGSVNLIIIFALWFWSGGNLRGLGLKKEGFGKHLGIGILFGFAMLLQHYLLTGPLIGSFVPANANQGIDMSILFQDTADIPFWILLSVFKGGFEEELWRSFEMNSFKRVFGRAGLIFGLIAGAIFFGIQHAYQGLDSVMSTGFDGLMYGLIYLRRRSVIEAMAAHATFDIVSILAGYYIYAG